jgi:hypothetical protein
MPRPPRIDFPDAVYHVTSRGNGRAEIFWSDDDRQRFLGQLSRRLLSSPDLVVGTFLPFKGLERLAMEHVADVGCVHGVAFAERRVDGERRFR